MASRNPGSIDAFPKATNAMSATSSSRPPVTRHQVKRSLSELAGPVRVHRHGHQPQHHHSSSRRDRSYDEKALSPVRHQMPTRYSLDIPTSSAPMSMMSPNQSRRASVLLPNEEMEAADTKEDEMERLRREQQKAEVRKDGLKRSLADLDLFSTNATRRLDETYYEVLEKMSALQTTITALKDLVDTSRGISDGFEKDSRELEHTIVRQLGAAGHFDEQQARISSLRGRIHGGRKKIETLSQRVDVVRERVEGWERADKAWQERTRKRLKIIWSIMSVLALLLAALSVAAKYAYTDVETLNGDTRNLTNRTASMPWRNVSAKKEREEQKGGPGLLWKTPMDEGEQLRVFDEL